jgi:hypothetical protein
MPNSKISEKNLSVDKAIYLSKYNREYYKKVKMLRNYKPIPLEAKVALIPPEPIKKKIVDKIIVFF